MDVLLMHCSVYEIPTSHRVGAMVHGGSADMRLLRGPGPDRELDQQWGGHLQRALDTERKELGGGPLPLGSVARAHRGRLHCNFLLWAVTSPAAGGAEAPTAPPLSAIHEAVIAALEFAAERSVERIAFSALGHGAGAVEADERFATIARAAHAYIEQRGAAGRSTGVEEVFLCESSAQVIRATHRRVPDLVGRVAGIGASSFGSGVGGKSPFKSRATPAGSVRGTATRSAGRAPSRARTKKPTVPAPVLTAAEITKGRTGGPPYETRRTYVEGDVLVHSKFGVGRVVAVVEGKAMQVVFEDQTVRKMAHKRG